MQMSPHLQAIRATVANLVDHIEAAAAREPEPQAGALARWIERHPLTFAVATLGLELLGAYLLADARRQHPPRRSGAPRIGWWNPPDRAGVIH